MKRLLRIAAPILIVLLAGATATVTQATPAMAANGPSSSPTLLANPVSVTARHSGKCLEVNGGSLAPGTGVLQWFCHRGQHQLWRINNLGNGYVSLAVEHSAQCLEVNAASLANGAGVLQWPCHGGTHQQWQQINLGNGYFQFRARHSGMCLEINAASLADGAGALQWPCHGGTHQQWYIW